jgi:hypothetical protein
LSLAWQRKDRQGPKPLALFTRQQLGKLEATRDVIMRFIGTKEALIPEHRPSALTWRKPLSLEEINQMAPTPEVRARPGRP